MSNFITDLYVRYLKSRHPFEYSQITENLYIAAWPTAEDADVIKSLGVRLVISMDWLEPDAALNEPPLRLICVTFKDMGRFTSVPMAHVRQGVQTALPVIHAGDGVLVYCKAGINRSPMMPAAF